MKGGKLNGISLLEIAEATRQSQLFLESKKWAEGREGKGSG